MTSAKRGSVVVLHNDTMIVFLGKQIINVHKIDKGTNWALLDSFWSLKIFVKKNHIKGSFSSLK